MNTRQCPDWLTDVRFWVFDLDDTLYPERDFVIGGFRAVAARVLLDLGIDVFPVLVRNFNLGVRNDAFRVAIEDFGLRADESYVKDLVATYREHSPVLTPFEDVVPLLEMLSRRDGCFTALVADGFADVQRRKLTALRLPIRFHSVIFTDDLGGRSAWKPNPVGLVLCLQELACREPSSAVYVADNPAKDFLAAHLAGMRAIRIARPATEHCSVEILDETLAPDLTLQSLAAIQTLLD